MDVMGVDAKCFDFMFFHHLPRKRISSLGIGKGTWDFPLEPLLFREHDATPKIIGINKLLMPIILACNTWDLDHSIIHFFVEGVENFGICMLIMVDILGRYSNLTIAFDLKILVGFYQLMLILKL